MPPPRQLNGPFWDALDAHYRAVFGFAWRMIGDTHLAEDVAQEAFARLAETGLPPDDVDAHRRWAFVAARNLCISHLRRASRHPATTIDETVPAVQPTPRDATASREHAAIIAEAVRALPPPMREVVLLREYEGLRYDEIAAIAGCSVGTVRSRLARAREALRVQLKPLLETDR